MLPTEVRLRDVTLRDGLQNERVVLSTDAKLDLLSKLVEVGFQTIEVTSFVRSDRIPALQDADEFARRLPLHPGVDYRALVPNRRGLERFLQAPVQTAVVFVSASDAHSRANVGKSTVSALQESVSVVKEAVLSGRLAVGAIATAFGCSLVGDVPVGDVLHVAEELLMAGATELSFADTVGAATPRMILERATEFTRCFSGVKVALHLHDPHGFGLTNVFAGVIAGISDFDVTLAGLGGCPYAPGAPGNLRATEVAHFLNRQDLHTGLDTELLQRADADLCTVFSGGAVDIEQTRKEGS